MGEDERALTRRGLIAASVLAGAAASEHGRRAAAQTPEPTPADCQLVAHAMGEACVPPDPRRVVTLDPVTLEHLVALGVVPVGHPLAGGVAPHLREAVAGATSLGTYGEPSLETIARLAPDLVVVWHPFAEDAYDQLAQIAPTVVTDRQGFDDWPADLRFVAMTVGREAEAERLLATYDARVAALRERVAALPEPPVVSTIRFTGGDGGRLLTTNSFSGVVLSAVGLRQPPAQQEAAPFGFVDVSAERIPDLGGDVIFVVTGSFDAVETEDQRALRLRIERSPLWRRLPAVRAGRVFPVSAGHWYEGSVLGANLMLDDLERVLLAGATGSATPGIAS